MKRTLDDKEKEVSEKQLEVHKDNLKRLKANLDYNKALLKKQGFLRSFDDKWREYLRGQKDDEDDRAIKMIENEIENEEEHIKILTDQLKDGVEIRQPTGV